MADEPDRITIQHVLVSFDETPVQAKRSREEAEALAQAVLERAQGGEDFVALVREHSDDPIQESDPQPGTYSLLNHGQAGEDFAAVISELNGRAAEHEAALTKRIEGGELSVEQGQEEMNSFIEGLQTEAEERQASFAHPRGAMVPAFGDVGFGLGVGEVGLATYDTDASPFGWHIIKRLA